MWITRQISPNFRQEYTIETKILDARSKEHILEIFKSDDFDQIAMIDEKYIMLKKYLYIESELNAHIGMCSHPDPKNVLILGGFNLEVAYEILRHEGVEVDFVQSDEKVFDSLISFLPNFSSVTQDIRFKKYDRAIDLPVKKYDLIICLNQPNRHEIDGISRMLSKEGILIFSTKHPLLEFDSFKDSISSAGEFFNIVMPFFAPLSIITDKGFVFASKRYHPLADMLLQKIDMLEGLKYYNPDIHQASFALPNLLNEKLKGILKN
ncbi:spermidine synthase [Helicobacter cappadocius]|uniref:Polyamine aminopropyltransferase n=1 Tax=Helicobacter cappadocius TaxID=3063998 RepID=A0AA90PTH1_9HELI|nr:MULTISPECIES: spermidine synthase [unclassified Helicobacter]MDO7252583.1 spermidine synthase [Helicobacter sp. faydin-H75]MDP2538450.1 spermidine synthase [Helicobacter sp. faydin-H76]